MSEQEKIMWHNKFKLWTKLNQKNWNSNTPLCWLCRHVDPAGTPDKYCPSVRMYLKWDDAGEEWVEESGEDEREDNLNPYKWCLEWIKNV